jgi:hypothetical protein
VRKNCSSDPEFFLKFNAEEQFIQTVKGQNNFLFLTSSWRLLISSKLEKLEFKLKKLTGM